MLSLRKPAPLSPRRNRSNARCRRLPRLPRWLSAVRRKPNLPRDGGRPGAWKARAAIVRPGATTATATLVPLPGGIALPARHSAIVPLMVDRAKITAIGRPARTMEIVRRVRIMVTGALARIMGIGLRARLSVATGLRTVDRVKTSVTVRRARISVIVRHGRILATVLRVRILVIGALARRSATGVHEKTSAAIVRLVRSTGIGPRVRISATAALVPPARRVESGMTGVRQVAVSVGTARPVRLLATAARVRTALRAADRVAGPGGGLRRVAVRHNARSANARRRVIRIDR